MGEEEGGFIKDQLLRRVGRLGGKVKGAGDGDEQDGTGRGAS
jgi:hypothetical protein